ncbi:MAG: hypothetical protein FWE01_03395 [Firmicutes bacterium]|nr:hypothetical protein [Bacillota bacterium]
MKSENEIIVSKFGGTSLATANNIRKVCDIVRLDERRQIIVVSAPGKRMKADVKITDSLITVADRFSEIEEGLGIENVARDYLLSRGEYLMARMMADVLGYTFVDIEKDGVIAFDEDGNFDIKMSGLNFDKYRGQRIVVPGFYGVMPGGNVRTFARGGSDITGAILANLSGAVLYENWTDVDGFYESDPNKVDANGNLPKCFSTMSYEHAEEMARNGANVLHPDCIEFVRKKGIPITVRNTFNLDAEGTNIKEI